MEVIIAIGTSPGLLWRLRNSDIVCSLVGSIPRSAVKDFIPISHSSFRSRSVSVAHPNEASIRASIDVATIFLLC